jgi:hypothetical protein
MSGRSNCVGAWSCLRRAGIQRSLLSPPGEALWPSGPMGHGVQRRGRGGGQAAGPAATPEPAAPSAAAVPRETPTCSASLLFRLSGPQATACRRQFFARLLRCVQRPAGQRLCGSRAAGACLPALPAVWRHNHYGGVWLPWRNINALGCGVSWRADRAGSPGGRFRRSQALLTRQGPIQVWSFCRRTTAPC